MAEIHRIFERNGRPLKTTDAHREHAFQMAQEHGRTLFLAALEHWLMTAPKDTFTVKTGKDLETGEDKVEPITWLLREFLETGAVTIHIDIVRPFAHVARGDVLCFLTTIHDEDDPVQVTPQQVAALERLIEEHDERTLVSAHARADGMEDFLAHAADYIQEVKDQDDAIYVNRVVKTMGYTNSNELQDHKATVSAAILKLAGQIGTYGAEAAIKKSGPWKGRPFEDFLRFCEEAGKKADGA
jgi:hypothetical protein